MTNIRPRVVVAMSGGVDSSVAAALLVERGYDVVGMMLRLWSESGQEAFNRCCSPEAMGLARQVAGQLGIPFYVLDVQKPFKETVIRYFIDGYASGITPNPCLVCNQTIRWGLLREHAQGLGASYLATGHYARLQRNPSGEIQLLKGRDQRKDQSYVLSVLNQEKLSQTLFPVGDFSKEEIRAKAGHLGLLTAGRPDSQDLCFITKGDYRDFLGRRSPEMFISGNIVDTAGNVLGEHNGLANYTIGQRKGLGLSSPVAMYVKDKLIGSNQLLVAEKAALGKDSLDTGDFNWISGHAPTGSFKAQVKIRYQAREAWGQVNPLAGLGDGVRIEFEEPLMDITPGQLAAIYQGEVCLGGGLIQPNRTGGAQ